ncbi:MAG: hypothetical protein WDM85_19525 [Caulobacteraceae bacterium]
MQRRSAKPHLRHRHQLLAALRQRRWPLRQALHPEFTTNDDITRSLHKALLQAGLDDADDPIMTWRDPGQGVSQTAEPQ